MSQHEITQIGKYRIVDQIGEGAMGVVYRAIDPVLNRSVAIKVMSDAVARDDELRERFLREAQAAGSLQHPNVITIYDFGDVDGQLYLAMEFIEGEDLKDLLAKRVVLPLVDKLDIVIDVLAGLAYAHKRGIVHRDIKPANIRIGEEGRARIMDFGIAHLSSSNMTRTGVVVGSPAYMAPEQIVGGRIVPATDVFSVGAVLYELLTGGAPFTGDSIQSVMYKIVSQPTPELATESLGLPAALNTVVQRALAKDPADRYPTALDMANAMTAIRAGLDRAAIASKSISLRSIIDTALADQRAGKQRRAKRRTLLLAAIPITALAATVLAGVFLKGNGGETPAPTSNAPASVQPTLAATPQVPAADTTTPAASPTNGHAAPIPPAAKAAASESPASRTTKPDVTGPTQQEIMLFRALQTAAIEGRRRAVDAGATTEQMRSGDARNERAESLLARGRVSEAAALLRDATNAWSTAERDARVIAAAASARVTAGTKDSAKANPVPVPLPVTPPVVAPQATPKSAAVNPTAEIESAVASYARAIESRDIAQVRRAYPGITVAQATGFEQFFASVRSLKASFSLSSLDINDNGADGKLVGTYDYVTNGGKNERQPVSFQATFRRDTAGWKLVAVR